MSINKNKSAERRNQNRNDVQGNAKNKTLDEVEVIFWCDAKKMVANKKGIFSIDANGQRERICSRVEFLSIDIDRHGRHFAVARFYNRMGERCTERIALDVLQTKSVDFVNQLIAKGLQVENVAVARLALPALFKEREPTQIVKVVQRGWQCSGGEAHQPIYVDQKRQTHERNGQRFYLKPEGDDKVQTSGTGAQWNENLGRFAEGNPVLAISICAVAAAPCIELLGCGSIGIGLVGDTKSGKSTTAHVAKSFDGEPSVLADWNSTPGALFEYATQFNDALLVLDELGAGNAADAGQSVYSLLNGVGRGRLDSSRKREEVATFRGVVLSTAEKTLAEHLVEEGKKPRGGQSARLLTIRVVGEGGVFRRLHGLKSSGDVARHLKTSAVKWYGTPGKEWRRLLERDYDRLQAELIKRREQYARKFAGDVLDSMRDGAIDSAMRSFAVFAAVGETLIAEKIWDVGRGSARKAARSCFRKWLAEYSVPMMSKNQLLVLKLKGWLQKERDHFRPLAEFAANRKGLHGCVEEKAGERRFLILPQFLEAQFPQARDRSTLIAALKERNALIHGDGRNTHEKRLPGTRKERVRFFGVRESMLC